MRSLRFVAIAAACLLPVFAAAQMRPSVPGVSTGSSDPDTVLDNISNGFEAMATTFDLASGLSLKSNENLVAALISKEAATEQKKRREDAEKIENADERRAKLTEIASDPEIAKAVAAASKKAKELTEEQKKFVNKAHGLNLLAGLTFAKFVPDAAQVASGFGSLAANMTSPTFVAALDKRGGAKHFNEEIKPAVDHLNANKKSFDKSAGANLKLLQDLNKRFDLGEAKAASTDEANETSDF